jgi:glycolate oxidase iron-sulfur subunit
MSAETGAPRTYRDLISDCVHCGFCLPACPTYVSWGDEMDSPRGRIDLMKGVHDGEIALDASVVAHFDACLGCMACVTACPSGVQYDLLIESTRATVETRTSRAPLDRVFRALMFALMPYPERLRLLAVPLIAYAKSGLQAVVRRAGVLRGLPPRVAQLDALLPPLTFADLRRDVRPFTAAQGVARANVGLVAGCVQRAFFPNVNAATVRVLSAEGCDVSVPAGQGCCGALSLHSGRLDEAKRFARALIERFETVPVDTIVINAAGCGSTLKEYGELLANEPAYAQRARAFAAKVRDVNEYLVTLEPRAPRAPIVKRVAYHDACHLAHAQRVREAPRALLQSIPGLELIEIPQGEMCCGSAGTYNLFQPASAHEIGERKVDNVTSVAPDILASANPGCTIQIQSIMRERGAALAAAHPIELLDQAISSFSGGGSRSRYPST